MEYLSNKFNKMQENFKSLSFRDKTAYLTAIASFILGALMAFIGLFLPPVGEISGSVLSYTGMATSYTASILGVSMYFKQKVDKIEGYVESKFKEKEK